MIKRLFASILILGVLTLLVISADISTNRIDIVHNNTAKQPIDIELNRYICTESRMLITDLYNSAQAIMPNGDTYFFNDIGNAFIWLMRQKNKDEIILYVYATDSKHYILAKNAWYSRDEATPMGYGFGAYEFHMYGTCDYYYDEVLLCAARGETLINPFIYTLLQKGKQLL
ncbi:hypothetical protein KDD93_07890 [Campylobacter sp. faydin G-24]|uniref:Uncharacterized protein n=1 Tax=Campylobacter anatolicus TaxID=2829105 RepID=A0ABS5HLD9_9BACT|nr:hypothetical protein [Campylobacter anatolicus]MBR8461335.1 hypothetical protein [Campylobacter anatolicus]MBR8464482.1 hypothetical protein [Campylobacter anatolicus]MBR8466305.1 hypothetical protein [Campylobacter anatolicus]